MDFPDFHRSHTSFLDPPRQYRRTQISHTRTSGPNNTKTLPCCTDRLNPPATLAGFLILQSLLSGQSTEPKTEKMSDEARPSGGRSKKRSVLKDKLRTDFGE